MLLSTITKSLRIKLDRRVLFMKKLICVGISLILVFMSSIGVFAKENLTKEDILKDLESGIETKSGRVLIVDDTYIKKIENIFADVELNDEQLIYVQEYVNKIKNIIAKDYPKSSKKLGMIAKLKILKLTNKAIDDLDLNIHLNDFID